MPPALVEMLPPIWLEPLEALFGHHAGAATHGAVDGIEIFDMVEPVQCQHQFAMAGDGARAQPGAPPGGHNRNP